jgi:hypothetical protein
VCTGAAAATEATANLRAAIASTGAVAFSAPVVSSKRRGSLITSTFGIKNGGGGGGGGTMETPGRGLSTAAGGAAAPTPSSSSSAAAAAAASSSFAPPSSVLVDRKKLRVRSGPMAVMLLDALVQKRLAVLAGLPPSDPIFGLPARLVDAMTVFVDPLPLHWGDAIATLANLRADEDPQKNVASVTMALAYMDGAYVKYCRDRAAYLAEHPYLPGAGEAGALAGVRGLQPDDLGPLVHFCIAKATIDRPVLSAVLAHGWLLQRGLAAGRDGFAVAAFRGALEWAASVPLPGE